MKKLISTVLCLFILLSCILPAMAATGVPEEVMESTKSVVRILSKYYNGAATGSGFVIKNEPGEVLIATNDHVVEGNPTSISIWVGEDRMVNAEIVFTTSEKDLCVLKVTDTVDMKPLKLSKEEPQHGAAIYVVGYPGAGDILSDTQAHTSESVTITDGIISAIRSFTIEKGGNPVKLLQVNAAINSGNSGGPLFDTEGVVVGVNTYKVNVDSQGVFGSVAISELWSLLNQYGIEIPDESEVVEKVTQKPSFLMPVLICVGIVCLVLAVILIAKSRSRKTPQRKRRDLKVQTITLQAHMEKYPQGLGIGGAVSLLLPAAIQLRNLHNDGKLHLQIGPENILIGAEGASLKDPSSQETGRFNSGFAAPEIYRGAGFGITSDIYSFAAVLLYAATGKVPANSLQQEVLEQDFALLEDVTFAQIIRKAMASNIMDRTQSMQELIYSIAVYKAPVQERKIQPEKQVVHASVKQTIEKVSVPVPEAPIPAESTPKQIVPLKKNRKILPVAAALICGIVAIALIWNPSDKAAENNENMALQGTENENMALQSTDQEETTVPTTAEEIAYAEAEQLLAGGETAKAAIAFGKLGDYRDARQRSFELWEGDTVSAGTEHVAAVKKDGSVVAVGNERGQECCQVQDWNDIVSVAASDFLTAGLKSDGTVVVTNSEMLDFREAVSRWEDIVQIAAVGRSVVGLKADGTITLVKQVAWENGTPICELDEDLRQWTDIIAISVCNGNRIAGRNDWKNSPAIAGLRKDGTVMLHGFDEKIVQKVSKWRDIASLHAANYGICGRKADGTVVGAYLNQNIADCVSKWTNIVDIDSSSVEGGIYVVGVKSDGTIAAWGDRGGLDGASNWIDIVSVDIGDITFMCFKRPIIGLKADGTVLVTGWRGEQPDLSAFTEIRLP